MSEVELPGGRKAEAGVRNVLAENCPGVGAASAMSPEKTCAGTYLGGMFSGLLDQSDTQSTLFFKTSTSFSPSATSSSDCEEELQL